MQTRVTNTKRQSEVRHIIKSRERERSICEIRKNYYFTIKKTNRQNVEKIPQLHRVFSPKFESPFSFFPVLIVPCTL